MHADMNIPFEILVLFEHFNYNSRLCPSSHQLGADNPSCGSCLTRAMECHLRPLKPHKYCNTTFYATVNVMLSAYFYCCYPVKEPMSVMSSLGRLSLPPLSATVSICQTPPPPFVSQCQHLPNPLPHPPFGL